jgi:hypothetical protein
MYLPFVKRVAVGGPTSRCGPAPLVAARVGGARWVERARAGPRLGGDGAAGDAGRYWRGRRQQGRRCVAGTVEHNDSHAVLLVHS